MVTMNDLIFPMLTKRPLKLATCAAAAFLCVSQAYADETGLSQDTVTHDIGWITSSDAAGLDIEDGAADTMSGKLRAYRNAQHQLIDAIEKQYVVFGEYQRLLTLSDDQIASEFPNGTYVYALSVAATSYGQLRREALMAEDIARTSLHAVIGSRRLSDEAMTDLHSLLGL